MATADRPVWGADVPISLPVPAEEAPLVEMFGFAMTQYRLVHNLSAAEYEALGVPIFAPEAAARPTVHDDADLDAGKVTHDGP